MKYAKLLVLLITITFFSCGENSTHLVFNQGNIYGTSYHIKYYYTKDLNKELLLALNQVDHSLSTFNKKSIISKINRNEETSLDSHFVKVISSSLEIAKNTNGYFDITVSPLVNLWGFGFKDGGQLPSDEKIQEVLNYVGYQKISFDKKRLVKQDPRTIITTSAIAKGYGVDVAAEYLEKQGIQNYLVEIGGEVRAKGTKPDGSLWKIGIAKPVMDKLGINTENIKILEISDKAVATSGNYRNYYKKEGKLVAHTISPVTGKPSISNLLSVSVLAENCMVADAYATAYMSMGLEKARENIIKQKGIAVYLVYRDEDSDEIKIEFKEGVK